MTELTHELLRSLLQYEQDTGSFFWKVRRQGIRIGMEAGNPRARKSGGRNIYLGVFETAEMAQAAYLRAANKIYGEFARIA